MIIYAGLGLLGEIHIGSFCHGFGELVVDPGGKFRQVAMPLLTFNGSPDSDVLSRMPIGQLARALVHHTMGAWTRPAGGREADAG